MKPPAWVFNVVWPILYFTILLSGIQCVNKCSTLGWTFFYLQLFFNLIWPIIYFKLNKKVTSFFVLILIIIFTLLFILETNNIILIPYLLWLIYAGFLSFKTK